MTEISTGRPPHYDIEYDETLAIQIFNGLRPEISKGTPECYIQLANQCMDDDPSNRPSASFINNELTRWYNIVDRNAAKDEKELIILKAFQSADTIIPTLSIKFPICSEDKLTNSTSIDLSISDDFIDGISWCINNINLLVYKNFINL
ncbi:hypothetical protein C2G38_2141836 [Gigaspora rosea]|uniref:Serine-threonine/tyrosine-protein kinase catalytic domain-containing protein n=1 Tax=Gigaspora rosea TaxID=44941 RepID=A0A397V999_9GLOM|nr:hypothetical protein C2G38_2141836 [Gigaspora rosea]